MYPSASRTNEHTLNFLLKILYYLGILPKLHAKCKRNIFRVIFICAIFIIGISSIVIIKEYREFIKPGAFNILNHLSDVLMTFLVILAVITFGICKFDATKQLFLLIQHLNHKIPERKQANILWYKSGVLFYCSVLLSSLVLTSYFWNAADGNHYYELILCDHILIGYVHMLVVLMWYIWSVVRLSFRELNTKLDKEDIHLYEADGFLVWHASIADCVALINDIFGWILFGITCQEVLYILNALYFDINESSEVSSSYHYIFMWWSGLTVTQGVIVAVMCERVVDEGKRTIIISCNTLDRYLTSSAIREKLFILAQQATTRCPKFSAAGFFNVDFAMLFTFLNLITTYVVVILQFSNKI